MSMKNVGDLMKRLQKMMPAHVEPAFKTGEELLAWQKEQGKLRSEALEREKRASTLRSSTAISPALSSPESRVPEKTTLPPLSATSCCCGGNRY